MKSFMNVPAETTAGRSSVGCPGGMSQLSTRSNRWNARRLKVRFEASEPIPTMCSANGKMATDASQPMSITKSDNWSRIRLGILRSRRRQGDPRLNQAGDPLTGRVKPGTPRLNAAILSTAKWHGKRVTPHSRGQAPNTNGCTSSKENDYG